MPIGQPPVTPEVAMGRAIAAVRIIRGMSRTQLAAKGECSYPYICGIENGNISSSVRKLDKIAGALNTTLGQLTKFAEEIELGIPPI